MGGSDAVGRWLVGIGLVVVLAAIVVSIFLLVPRGDEPGGSSPTSAPTTPGQTSSATALPTPLATPTTPAPDPGTPLAPVTPFITSAGADGGTVTVYGFVPGLGEDGGTCRAYIVGGAADESAEGAAFVEAGNTSCPPIVVPITTSGSSFSVALEYRSATSSGVSEPFTVSR
jgi:hypothetical protein